MGAGFSKQEELLIPLRPPPMLQAITLSFGGHACFPSLEAGMASPGDFGPVLNAAYAAMLSMCVKLG